MAKLAATTFDGLNSLHQRRRRNRITIGHNTESVVDNDDTIYIRLHNSPIVKLTRDGGVDISLAGYHTVTTRERINQFLPGGYRLYQQNWEQYLSTPDGEIVNVGTGWHSAVVGADTLV